MKPNSMNPMSLNRFIKPTLATTVLLLLLGVTTAYGKDYKVEVVVFMNLNDQRAYEAPHSLQNEVIETEATTWLIEPSMLIEQANRIKRSANYRLVQHYSWGQESLPVEQAATYMIAEPLLQGHIKVYAEQLLFTNIDIDFNGYHLTEKRRLKLDEKHFFDHPKFGVLMQVSRLPAEPEESDTLTDPANTLSQ